jgi:hypothetical protein
MQIEGKPNRTDVLQQESVYGPIALSDFLQKWRGNSDLMQHLQSLAEAQPALIHGAHYWRTISENGFDFYDPGSRAGSPIIAFSRILNGVELLCAINLHEQQQVVFYITLDSTIHDSGSRMRCIYASSPTPPELNVEDRNGKALRLTVPPMTFVIYC